MRLTSILKYLLSIIISIGIISSFVVLFNKWGGNPTQRMNIALTSTPPPLTITPKATISIAALPSSQATVSTGIKLSKKSYTLALYGDSMIDTMAEYEDFLHTTLQTKYPGIVFTIANYGIGAQNIEGGLDRWETAFSNRGRTYPPITQLKPDAIVIGAFSYNPFSPHDREQHKTLLTQLVTKAKQTGALVYVLAEIAPLGADFGDGEKGVNWPDEQSIEHSNRIIENIQNVFIVAQEQGIPVVNAYESSRSNNSSYGEARFTNPDDGIHPSDNGHALVIQRIVAALNLK